MSTPGQATHHGPWCDEDPQVHACGACWPRWDAPRPGAPLGVGAWLLARLACHFAYAPRVGARQEPIDGLDLSSVDRLELARVTLALAEAGALRKRSAQ